MLERTTDPSGAGAVKGQVLLVDDEEQVLNAYARMLRSALLDCQSRNLMRRSLCAAA